jgi:hypothetical protein
MTQEALKLALEALQFALHVGFSESSESEMKKGEKAYQQHRAAITAIKEALAQEQEPVAWRTFDGEGGYDYRSYEDNESYADDWDKRNPNHKGWVDKLYARPQRTWAGLTDEQIDACWNKDLWKEKQPHHIFAKAIEAKLKEKNNG